MYLYIYYTIIQMICQMGQLQQDGTLKSRTKTPEHVSHWCHNGFCTSRWGSGWGSNTDRNFEVTQWRCLRRSSADQGMYGALRSARDLKRWCVSLCIVRWLECQQKGVFIFSEPLMIHQSHLGSQPGKNQQKPSTLLLVRELLGTNQCVPGPILHQRL